MWLNQFFCQFLSDFRHRISFYCLELKSTSALQLNKGLKQISQTRTFEQPLTTFVKPDLLVLLPEMFHACTDRSAPIQGASLNFDLIRPTACN